MTQLNSQSNSVESINHLDVQLLQVTQAEPGSLEDAKQLIDHLENYLYQKEPFYFLFHSNSISLWFDEAETYFTDWWVKNLDRLSWCRAVVLIVNAPKRSRLLTEFILSRKYVVPHKCFKTPEQARAWVQKHASTY